MFIIGSILYTHCIADDLLTPYTDRPTWPEKEPIMDPVVEPAIQPAAEEDDRSDGHVFESEPTLQSEDMGKTVDRGARSSTRRAKRGRLANMSGASTSKVPDPDIIEIASTASNSPPPTRRSARPKTPSGDPVPRVVSTRTRPKKRAKRGVTLILTPSVRVISPATSHPLPIPKPKVEDGIVIVFEDVIYGGVRMTKDGVYLLPSDDERETKPCRFILNNNSGILWVGPRFLHYLFWALIPRDRNLDQFQQAVCLRHALFTSRVLIRSSANALCILCEISDCLLCRTWYISELCPL